MAHAASACLLQVTHNYYEARPRSKANGLARAEKRGHPPRFRGLYGAEARVDRQCLPQPAAGKVFSPGTQRHESRVIEHQWLAAAQPRRGTSERKPGERIPAAVVRPGEGLRRLHPGRLAPRDPSALERAGNAAVIRLEDGQLLVDLNGLAARSRSRGRWRGARLPHGSASTQSIRRTSRCSWRSAGRRGPRGIRRSPPRSRLDPKATRRLPAMRRRAPDRLDGAVLNARARPPQCGPAGPRVSAEALHVRAPGAAHRQ